MLDIKDKLISKQASKQASSNIYVFRFFMSVAVVAIHTHPLEQCHNYVVIKIYEAIVSFAVPFFFITSGHYIGEKLRKTQRSEMGSMVEGYIKKYAKIYLIWTMIYLPLTIYHFASLKESLLRSVIVFFRNFVLVGQQYNSWQLWYLLSTIYALVVIYTITKNRARDIDKTLFVACFVASILSVLCTMLINEHKQMPYFFLMIGRFLRYSICDGRIFNGTVYISIGIILEKKRMELNKGLQYTIFMIGFLCLCIVNNDIISYYVRIITSVILFLIVVNLKCLPIIKHPQYLKIISTTIYFIHMYIWSVYYKIKYGIKTFGLDCFINTMLITFTIGVVYVIIKEYFRKTKQNIAI